VPPSGVGEEAMGMQGQNFLRAAGFREAEHLAAYWIADESQYVGVLGAQLAAQLDCPNVGVAGGEEIHVADVHEVQEKEAVTARRVDESAVESPRDVSVIDAGFGPVI
jgi:hypothetical protein